MAAVHKTGERDQVYHEHSRRSFFADVVSQQHDPDAADRLRLHSEVNSLELDASTSTFPGHVPPAFEVAHASAKSTAHPLYDAITRTMLPDHGMNVEINDMTTLPSAAWQSAQAVDASDTDAASSKRTVPVTTVASYQAISAQALHRGTGIDAELSAAFASSVAEQIDAAMLNGTGASGQPSGLLKSGSITAAHVVEADSASPTAALIYAALAKQAQTLAEDNYRPSLLVMHPRRFAHLMADVDVAQISQSRLFGASLIVDPNVPKTLGTSSDQDIAIMLDGSQLRLWESPLYVRPGESLSENHAAELIAYRYVAFRLLQPDAAAATRGTLFAATL